MMRNLWIAVLLMLVCGVVGVVGVVVWQTLEIPYSKTNDQTAAGNNAGSDNDTTSADDTGVASVPSASSSSNPEKMADSTHEPSTGGNQSETSEDEVGSSEQPDNKKTEKTELKESLNEKKVSAGELISALSDSLKWKLWVVVTLAFFFIAAYLFFLWGIAQAAKRIESYTEEIRQRFDRTDSTLHEIKTQMPIRGARTEDLSNQLKETYERIAEKATDICKLSAPFQALFVQLQKSEKTARELGVDNADVSLDDEQLPISLQIQSIDQQTQMDKDALQIRRLLDEIKASHSKNVALTFSRSGHIDSLKSRSDLVLGHIPGLLDRMLQISEHIASLFEATLTKLSQVSDENHQLNKQLGEKSVKIVNATNAVTHYSNLLADELKKIGYLDRKGGFDITELNKALAEFKTDSEKRPGLLEYGRSLSSLRRYLSNESVHDLPYFDAVGLRQLFNKLDDKNSLSKLFRSETPADNLKGQWKEFLHYIYRAILLLDTYWPNADKELHAKLEQTRSTTDLLLRSQGIAPHTLSLLEEARVDNTTIQETRNATIPRELESNETFRDRVKPLSDSGLTYCDVTRWGYDIIRDDRVVPGEPTLLVTKEPKDRWA